MEYYNKTYKKIEYFAIVLGIFFLGLSLYKKMSLRLNGVYTKGIVTKKFQHTSKFYIGYSYYVNEIEYYGQVGSLYYNMANIGDYYVVVYDPLNINNSYIFIKERLNTLDKHKLNSYQKIDYDWIFWID